MGTQFPRIPANNLRNSNNDRDNTMTAVASLHQYNRSGLVLLLAILPFLSMPGASGWSFPSLLSSKQHQHQHQRWGSASSSAVSATSSSSITSIDTRSPFPKQQRTPSSKLYYVVSNSTAVFAETSSHPQQSGLSTLITESSSSVFPKDEQLSEEDEPPRVISRYGHDHEAWKNCYTNCPHEIPPTWIDCPNLPSDFPAGTYFRNGHARFQATGDGTKIAHMFDGDGMMVAATLDPSNQRILFRNRFIRTAGYRQDMERGDLMTKPGVFGTRVSAMRRIKQKEDGGTRRTRRISHNQQDDDPQEQEEAPRRRRRPRFYQNWGRLDFKNVANTHCLYRADKLYALWEAGWPHVLDPLTLENDVQAEPKGHNLNGLLKRGDFFAAHYRIDAHTGNMVNFGCNLQALRGRTEMKLWEFDADMQPIRDDAVSFVFPGAGVLHDFAITENWHIFATPPAKVGKRKALQALLGKAAIAEIVDYGSPTSQSTTGTDSQAFIYLVPRMKHLKPKTAKGMHVHKDDRIKVISVPYHFNFHFANAFENEDGSVTLDSVQVQEVQFGNNEDYSTPLWETADVDDYYPAKYVRITMDPQTESLVEPPRSILEHSNRDPEFPSIPIALSAKRHRYAYTVGSHRAYKPFPNGKGKSLFGAILKIDTENPTLTESYEFLPHEFVGEQVFCPKEGADIEQDEDKGYLVTYVANGKDLTSDLLIFDVEGRGALERGPVARIRLPTYIPPGLHGTFAEGLTFDDA